MKADFDLDKKNKRMPYTVPEGFFEQLEEGIWQAVQSPTVAVRPSTIFYRFYSRYRSVAAVAFVLLLLGAGCYFWYGYEREPSWEVEQAFTGLSVEDQDYLLFVYQEDLFMND